MLSRTTIRWFFILLLPLLLGQLLIAKKYEEPYPAIMFPGFGQVPPTPWYPYSYERMMLYAYSATDSVALTLDELFAPFPETALFAPMRNQLRLIADTITPTRGEASEQELLHYVRQRVRQQLGEDVQRVAFAFYQYQADKDGRVRLVDVVDRKVLYFQAEDKPPTMNPPSSMSP